MNEKEQDATSTVAPEHGVTGKCEKTIMYVSKQQVTENDVVLGTKKGRNGKRNDRLHEVVVGIFDPENPDTCNTSSVIEAVESKRGRFLKEDDEGRLRQIDTSDASERRIIGSAAIGGNGPKQRLMKNYRIKHGLLEDSKPEATRRDGPSEEGHSDGLVRHPGKKRPASSVLNDSDDVEPYSLDTEASAAQQAEWLFLYGSCPQDVAKHAACLAKTGTLLCEPVARDFDFDECSTRTVEEDTTETQTGAEPLASVSCSTSEENTVLLESIELGQQSPEVTTTGNHEHRATLQSLMKEETESMDCPIELGQQSPAATAGNKERATLRSLTEEETEMTDGAIESRNVSNYGPPRLEEHEHDFETDAPSNNLAKKDLEVALDMFEYKYC